MGGILPIILLAIICLTSRSYAYQKSKSRTAFLSSALIFMLLLGGCGGQESSGLKQPAQDENNLEVHFLDVGQGDSIFVKNGSKAMLIDTGDKNNWIRLNKYLDKQGIKKIDYLIGTNSLTEHIGGMCEMINNFEISRIFLPKISCVDQAYKDLQLEMLAKYYKPIRPEAGKSYPLGDASFTVLAPNSRSYDDLADNSIVIKLMYGETSFLLTSSAGKVSEQEMLDMEFDLSANVLKLGRHGSASSTGDEFLSAVNPDSAVISVGQDNLHSHPHMETMLKLKEKQIPVYRTDEQGTIIAVSDGHTITFNVEPGTYTWPEMIISDKS